MCLPGAPCRFGWSGGKAVTGLDGFRRGTWVHRRHACLALPKLHLGAPIQSLRAGKYDLGGEDTQLNSTSLERYQQSIQELVKRL